MSVGSCLVLAFTNCIILFTLVSFLLAIVCHLYMLLLKKQYWSVLWSSLLSFSLFNISPYKMLLAFSAAINFNVTPSLNKLYHSYTAFDLPGMYKVAEAKSFCLM